MSPIKVVSMVLTVFNCSVCSVHLDTLVISQRLQIMSFSVDHLILSIANYIFNVYFKSIQ